MSWYLRFLAVVLAIPVPSLARAEPVELVLKGDVALAAGVDIYDLVGTHLELKFPYDPDLVAALPYASESDAQIIQSGGPPGLVEGTTAWTVVSEEDAAAETVEFQWTLANPGFPGTAGVSFGPGPVEVNFTKESLDSLLPGPGAVVSGTPVIPIDAGLVDASYGMIDITVSVTSVVPPEENPPRFALSGQIKSNKKGKRLAECKLKVQDLDPTHAYSVELGVCSGVVDALTPEAACVVLRKGTLTAKVTTPYEDSASGPSGETVNCPAKVVDLATDTVLFYAGKKAVELNQKHVSRVVVSYPSTEFGSLHEAIDAAPDGATVEIGAGIHELDAPITISGKHLILAGQGPRGDDRTELKGPLPEPDVPIVAPEDSIGVLNFIDGGSADIYDMAFKGYHAAIVVPAPDEPDAQAPTMTIRNVAISETVRGILWRGGGNLSMESMQISDTRHNGMSLSATEFPPLSFGGNNISLFNVQGAGVYVDTPGTCVNGENNAFYNLIIGGSVGPGVVVLNGDACFFNMHTWFNRLAGVYAKNAFVLVKDSDIEFTGPDLQTGQFGDGVIALPGVMESHVVLDNTKIKNSFRAGVANMGSFVELFDVEIRCAPFELNGENLGEFNFSFTDGGGNLCGCPVADEKCVAVSASLAAPTFDPQE